MVVIVVANHDDRFISSEAMMGREWEARERQGTDDVGSRNYFIALV